MRARMRKELFERGVISPQQFEKEVRDRAIESQAREGLHNPFDEEPTEVWEVHRERTRKSPDRFLFCL